jgi:hypothetical protein
MRTCLLLCSLCALLVLPASADELLINGNFEEPLTTGWTASTEGVSTVITRATHYDPDPDYEAHVSKATGNGYARLSQIVDLPGLDAVFSANVNLFASATSTAWAAAALSVSYLGADEMPLGTTYIIASTHYCPWDNSPTQHMIPAVPSTWESFAFTIEDELANLPGIDPLDVRGLEVALYAFVYDC